MSKHCNVLFNHLKHRMLEIKKIFCFETKNFYLKSTGALKKFLNL